MRSLDMNGLKKLCSRFFSELEIKLFPGSPIASSKAT